MSDMEFDECSIRILNIIQSSYNKNDIYEMLEACYLDFSNLDDDENN